MMKDQQAPIYRYTGGKSIRYMTRPRLRPSIISSLMLTICLLAAASGMVFTSFSTNQSLVHAAASANTAALTYKGDNQRTGQYLNESLLTTSNVNTTQFGKHVSYPVDGQVYAQPLFVPNLTISGAPHNVVFVATEHDSIYAFDADQTSAVAPLWHTSFLSAGVTSVPYGDVSCNDLTPEIGITGTPVIDNNAHVIYLVAATKENGTYVDRLHALDITTGNEVAGSPVVIQPSVPGVGAGSVNGMVPFNALRERQRAALMQANGQIYVAFASFCDNGPFHGWVLGYTYNGSALQLAEAYNDTPNNTAGGIWGSGGGLAADSSGAIYISTGNGDFSLNTGGTEAGDSLVKLNAQLQLQDYFSPFNTTCLQKGDADLGSGGPLLIPNQNRLIGGGKEGRLYTIDTTNMGKFTTDPTLNCTSTERYRTDIDKVLQESPPFTVGGIYCNPAFWTAPTGQYVYYSTSGKHTVAYQLVNGLLSANPTSKTAEALGFTGGNPVISSNGTTSGTGILWLIDPNGVQPVLRAYDATNLATELYTSNQNVSRDALDNYVKFSAATVANGEVFVGTQDSVTIYGLLSTNPTPTPTATSISTATPTATLTSTVTPTTTPTPPLAYNNIGISDDSATGGGNFDGSGNSYSAQALQAAGLNPGDNAFYSNGMVFTWPNAVAGTADNYVANGQTVPVLPLSNATTLGFLGASSGGNKYGTASINYSDGSTQSFTLGFSDWTLTGGRTKPAYGNGTMVTTGYRNKASGKQTINTYVFYTDVSLQTGKTVKSVTLPAIGNQGAIHVFAIATKQSSVTPTPTPTPQASSFNNVGSSDDSNPGLGNFDGGGASYSVEALQSVGITAGGAVTTNGVTFTWPNVSTGTPNNYQTGGQIVSVTPVNNAGTLAFLGSSSGGAASGTATITYTDGSTQTFTLGFSDWTLAAGTGTPFFGNQIVATTSYRNTPDGPGGAADKPVVFYTDVSLQAGKTLKSVTLPANTPGPQLHIFSIATK